MKRACNRCPDRRNRGGRRQRQRISVLSRPALRLGWRGRARRHSLRRVWNAEVDDRRGCPRPRRPCLRSKAIGGDYGVPLVAYDGTSGGLSGDGKSLVLGSYGPLPGKSGKTRFVVLNARTLARHRAIVLAGSWSFDAVSPTADTLYLTQHLRAGDKPLYRVRAYDARSGHLGPPIVDRLEGEEEMGGQPVARSSSAAAAGRTRSTPGAATSRSSTRSTP